MLWTHVSNRQRWTFGGLYPEAYCQAQDGESSSLQTECLIHGSPATTVEAIVRFLHLTARQVGEVDPSLREWSSAAEPVFRPVGVLHVGGRSVHSWQEAQERETELGRRTLAELLTGPCRLPFVFPGGRSWEPVLGPAGELAGVLVRRQQALEGVLEAVAREVAPALYRLSLRVRNRTPLEGREAASREDALLRCLASTHLLLGIEQGEFVSLLEPPECWQEAAAACCNRGVWSVLVGEPGQPAGTPLLLRARRGGTGRAGRGERMNG